MGTIQNQFNQILAASFGAALAGERASVGMRELKAARQKEQSAFADAHYYSGLVRQGRGEVKDVKTLEELKDLEDEYSVAEQQAITADVSEVEAIEGKRQAELRYGTKREREIAAGQAGEYEQNMLIAKMGSGLEEAIEKKRDQLNLIEERRRILTENAPQSYPVRKTENYGRI